MRTLRYLVLVVSTLLPVAAQDSSPRKLITSVEGKDLFVAYCASCDGMAGRGDGPVSSALQTKIPDLATLAARRGGKFPGADLEKMIMSETASQAAHGTREMPVWGPVFRRVEDDKDLGLVRVRRLVEYVQTLSKTKR
ncbi:MAG: cytochrome c [Acidobacteria bacterium]|nr:cytochrome c [Acidobacteriota bacterium]